MNTSDNIQVALYIGALIAPTPIFIGEAYDHEDPLRIKRRQPLKLDARKSNY